MINKLSEAIRLGNMMIDDERCCFLKERQSDDKWCGCALGAGMFAIGIRDKDQANVGYSLTALREYFPILLLEMLEIKNRLSNPSLEALISNWHIQGVPREEIANRVAEIEAQHPELIKPLELEASDVAREFFQLEEAAK